MWFACLEGPENQQCARATAFGSASSTFGAKPRSAPMTNLFSTLRRLICIDISRGQSEGELDDLVTAISRGNRQFSREPDAASSVSPG
jgi:hypothetical protein